MRGERQAHKLVYSICRSAIQNIYSSIEICHLVYIENFSPFIYQDIHKYICILFNKISPYLNEVEIQFSFY